MWGEGDEGLEPGDLPIVCMYACMHASSIYLSTYRSIYPQNLFVSSSQRAQPGGSCVSVVKYS